MMEIISEKELHELLAHERPEHILSFLRKLLQEPSTKRESFLPWITSFVEKEVIARGREELFHEMMQLIQTFFAEEEGRLALANLYYRYGQASHKGRYFIYALHKISSISKESFPVYHLWGRILHALATYTEDSKYFEQAIAKYEQVLTWGGESFALLWNLASVWKELADRSTEDSDRKKAILYFRKAALLEPLSTAFLLDFAKALLATAEAEGAQMYLQEAIDLLGPALVQQGGGELWQFYAKLHSKVYELTALPADFTRASHVFQEAITAVPDVGELWLYWGELYLRAGIQTENPKEIESAIEKLTASKSGEISPLQMTAALSRAIAAMGYLLDDYSLLAQAKRKILTALEFVPENSQLLFALGSLSLFQGLYFKDFSLLQRAEKIFANLLTHIHRHPDLLFAYFFALWKQGDFSAAQELTERLISLRPASLFYLRQLGRFYLELSSHQEPCRSLEKALTYLKKAATLDEDFATLLLYGKALCLYGQVTDDEGYVARSLEVLRALYSKLPTDNQLLQVLAQALFLHGKMKQLAYEVEEAIFLLQTAAAREREKGELFMELGVAQASLAELIQDPATQSAAEILRHDAEKSLLQAASLGYPESYYQLATFYALMHQEEKALLFLKKAESLDALPSQEELEVHPWLENLRKSAAFQEFLEQRGNDE